MTFVTSAEIPQALQTGYSSRLRLGKTSLMISTVPAPRKRGISYAELDEEFDDDDEDPSFGAASESVSSSGYGRHGRHDTAKVEMKREPPRPIPIQYTESQMAELAEKEEVLIPIRLQFDVENNKVVDFILWNYHEQSLTPEQFAIMTCKELDLPVGYTSNIVNAIKVQLHEYAELATINIPRDTELHVIINVSINLHKELFEDKFEWDLGNSDVTPEEFAKCVVADLGLDREFVLAITHALYEQILRIKRAIFVDGRLIDVDNEVAGHAKSREAGLRYTSEANAEDWIPSMETLSQSDLERREMERERMIRRMKRESARSMNDIDVGSMLSRKRRRHVEF